MKIFKKYEIKNCSDCKWIVGLENEYGKVSCMHRMYFLKDAQPFCKVEYLYNSSFILNNRCNLLIKKYFIRLITRICFDYNIFLFDSNNNYYESYIETNSKLFDMNEKQLRNTGFSCGSNIELGKCDNNTIKFAIFFHEVGHVIQERKKFKYINTFQKELNATKIGLNIARKYGFKINHEIKMFLSKCAYHYSKCNRSRLKLRRLDFCK